MGVPQLKGTLLYDTSESMGKELYYICVITIIQVSIM